MIYNWYTYIYIYLDLFWNSKLKTICFKIVYIYIYKYSRLKDKYNTKRCNLCFYHSITIIAMQFTNCCLDSRSKDNNKG